MLMIMRSPFWFYLPLVIESCCCGWRMAQLGALFVWRALPLGSLVYGSTQSIAKQDRQ